MTLFNILLENYDKSQIVYCLESTTFLDHYCIKNPKIGRGKKYKWDIEQPNGIISPTGDIYYVPYMSHDHIFKYYFKTNKDTATKNGWLSISTSSDCGFVNIDYKSETSVFKHCDYDDKYLKGFNYSFLSEELLNILAVYLPSKVYPAFWTPDT